MAIVANAHVKLNFFKKIFALSFTLALSFVSATE